MTRIIPSIGPDAAPAAPEDFSRLTEPYAAEMEMLDRFIAAEISLASRSFFPEAVEMARGGKRIRAFLCIAASRVFSSDIKCVERAVSVAAFLECIHLSSLLHDDVIDNAAERRGLATLHRRYGRTGAILAGDMLYVRIFRRLMDLKSDRLMRIIVDSAVEMVDGETQQTIGAFQNREPSIEEYLTAIGRKTAAFFRAAAEAGALTGMGDQVDEEKWQRFSTYGHHFGMLFQIMDDILDWNADPELLGKDLMADIRSGKMTLPMLLFLEDDPVAARGFIARASDGAVMPLLTELKRRGCLRRAARLAEKHVKAALDAIEPWGEEVNPLLGLLDFAARRCY